MFYGASKALYHQGLHVVTRPQYFRFSSFIFPYTTYMYMYFHGNESSIGNLNAELFEETTCKQYKKMTLYSVKEMSHTIFLLRILGRHSWRPSRFKCTQTKIVNKYNLVPKFDFICFPYK